MIDAIDMDDDDDMAAAARGASYTVHTAPLGGMSFRLAGQTFSKPTRSHQSVGTLYVHTIAGRVPTYAADGVYI